MNSIEKTLAVLRALAVPGPPHQLADLAIWAGVGKPTAHRILQTLVGSNYAYANGDGGYLPGPALHALGVSAGHHIDLDAIARPVLAELQSTTGHTVHFAVRSGRAAVYVAKIEGDKPYQMASRIGMQIQLHRTAIGKAVLAALPVSDRAELLTGEDSEVPPALAPVLLEQLDVIAERGYAIDDEENEPHVRCVGAPVYTSARSVLGGVSVSGLTYTFTPEDLHRAAEPVMAAARQLSRALGSEIAGSR